jgi:diacylglycerol kinase family enzyme
MCNGTPFLLWAGVGLDAFIVHNLEPRTRFEKHFAFAHYTATAAWNSLQWRGVNMKVEIEGQEVSGHYLLAIVSNIHLYAGGLVQLSSRARLDDGIMDLWLFKGDTLADTVQRVLDLLTGAHLTSDQIACYPFHSLQLSSGSRTYIQTDGEPVLGGSPVHVSVLPKALKVLLPQRTALPLFGDQDL